MPENTPVLYRKRLIPSECIRLKDDRLIYRDEDILITAWNTLHPKKDLDHGFSCYMIKEGWKISRFLKKDGSLLHWYFDIIDTEHDTETDTYVFVDLLADVIISPDGMVRVVDLDEVADALDAELITNAQMKSCMRKLNKLLEHIYSGELFESPEVNKLKELG